MKVSFAIVARNEEKSLSRILEDLTYQDYPHENIEVLLVDSMSKDNTLQIMKNFAENSSGFADIKVLLNEGKVLPSGNNVVLDNYTGDVLVRVDAHGAIPSDFISKNVEIIKSGEKVCGGRRPNLIEDANSFRETLLCAEQSMFGSSIAPYRNAEQKMYISSLFCGMYLREVFDTVGKYNENLYRTEDNDMSYRIRKAGYKLCFSPDIVSYQYTRNTLFKMLKQKFLNGFWIGRTLGVNPKCFSVFHFVPLVFVLSIIFSALLSFLGYPLFALLLLSAYSLFVILITIIEIIKKPRITNLLLPFIFALLHICYGVGTLLGILSMPIWLMKIKGKSK